jgi:rod shape determining protein RodA
MQIFVNLKKIYSINIYIIIFVFLIFMVGIFTLYSVAGGSFTPWAFKQIFFFVTFLPIMIAIALIDVRILYKFSYFFYLVPLFLLIYVDFFGHKVMGASRWLRIANFSLQPSEIMKIGLATGLSRYFQRYKNKQIIQNKYLIMPSIMIILPVALVLKQPDLGTAFILISIGIGIFFIIGVQWWKFAICGVLLLVSTPFIWKYALYDYQRKRIEIFLNPEQDTSKDGYNIAQSKIAIGSGGIYGRGYLQGTQNQLSFLPEKQTDFIFTSFMEEIGFIGALFIISIYSVLIYSILIISHKTYNIYNKIIVCSVAIILFFHIFINIGMTIGVLPVVGIPLPFMSYGGTITASSLVMIGFVLNADLYKNDEIN